MSLMAEPYNPDEENESNTSIEEIDDDDDEDTEENESETDTILVDRRSDDEEVYNLDEEENEWDNTTYELDDDGEYTEEEEEEERDEEEYIPLFNSPRVSANFTNRVPQGGELLLIGDEIGGCSCSQGKEWNRTEIDGLFCPICMDAWTTEGNHRICCLPCGHLYGLSCISKWLRKSRSSAKCPQCNRECSLKDVRKLFAPRIVAIDNEAQETIRALEVKCALLEKKNADSSRNESQLRKNEAKLLLKVKELTEVEGRLGQLQVQTIAIHKSIASQHSLLKELAADFRKFKHFFAHESSKGVQLDTSPGSPQH